MNKYQICTEMNPFPKDSYQREILLDGVPISNFDVWVYLIGCSFALFMQLILVTLFFFMKKLRQSPGDIFFGSLIFETIMSAQWLMSSAIQYQRGAIHTQWLTCQFQSGLNIAAHTGQMLYVIAFFHYLTQQVNTSFKPNRGRTWKLHMTIILLTLTVITLAFGLSLTGKEMDGQCSLQIFKMPDYVIIIGYVLLLVIYTGVGSYSIVYIRKNIPLHYKMKAQKFLQFSIIYFLTYLCLTVVTQSIQILASLNCTFLLNMNLGVMYGFTAVLDICNVISLPIIRAQDPYTKRVLLKTFHLTTSEQKYNLDQSQAHNLDESELTKSTLELTDIRPKSQTEDNTFVNMLQNNKRTQIMGKIIGALQIDQYSKFNLINMEVLNMKYDNIFEEKKILNFKGDELITQLPGTVPNQYIEILEQNLQMKLIIYTPIIFHVIMNREQVKIDILSALNINENLEKIRSAGKNDGGKSGQFFFYSQNNQIIIKTITQQELRILLSILKDYFQYILKNPQTLIAKIYGIYTFEQSNQKNINIIVMKNIAQTNQTYRIYDLKGSSFDREVAKKDMDLSKVVLKDLDFLKIERYLFVNKLDAKQIVSNAQKDSQFFRKCGLIDYSLIVFKILNDNDQKQQNQENKSNVFQCDDGRYRYHIGIIDYLQEYNVQKRMEKYSKKFIKLNQNLDTSSQDPIVYCQRFSNFVEKIVK